jgi:hypothetical protein
MAAPSRTLPPQLPGVEVDAAHIRPSNRTFARMERALGTLRPLLADFPVSKVHVAIQRHSRDGTYDVRVSLRLPQHTLSVQEAGEGIDATFHACVRRLVRAVTEYKSELRGDEERVKHAEGTHHEIVANATPDEQHLGAAIANQDYLAFRRALGAFDEPLRQRIGRWVRRDPGVEAALGRGLSVDDLVEEVLLLAFDEYERRPSGLRMGDWFEQLVPRAIEQFLRDPDGTRGNLDAVRAYREA